jgi:hypothetical protein
MDGRNTHRAVRYHDCIGFTRHERELLRFRGYERHRSFGALLYCESSPQRLWVSKSRARDSKGNWGIWHLVSNRPYAAQKAAQEYGRRFGCEIFQPHYDSSEVLYLTAA